MAKRIARTVTLLEKRYHRNAVTLSIEKVIDMLKEDRANVTMYLDSEGRYERGAEQFAGVVIRIEQKTERLGAKRRALHPIRLQRHAEDSDDVRAR